MAVGIVRVSVTWFKARIILWEKKRSHQKIHLWAFSFAFSHTLQSSKVPGVCSVVTWRITPISPAHNCNSRWKNQVIGVRRQCRYLARFWNFRLQAGEWNFLYVAHLKMAFKKIISQNNVSVNLHRAVFTGAIFYQRNGPYKNSVLSKPVSETLCWHTFVLLCSDDGKHNCCQNDIYRQQFSRNGSAFSIIRKL